MDAPRTIRLLACLVCIAVPTLVRAQPQPERLAGLSLEELSLEQLAEIRITSVSRREERLAGAAASIYVITSEDIRRSGVTNIVDVLRLAPNLFVGRGDSNQAIIGARGQYAGTSNKMLVLVDGRTIYTPLFSGVFWDQQDFVLEDIERIEVISGPGATLWGSNAVNGVINITTRRATRDGKGVAVGFAGDFERGAVLRSTAPLGDDAAYRVYAKYRQTDERRLDTGAPAQDRAERSLAGIRADWERGTRSASFEAEAYKALVGNLGGDRDMTGAHVLGRWQDELAQGSHLRMQGYYDHTERLHQGSFAEKLDILDLDVQHERPGAAHTLVSGGGYRAARDNVDNTAVIGFDPALAYQWWANAFVQDEWALAKDLQLTFGLKGERNPYTGVEWLPNARFTWRFVGDHVLWGALSRAIRAPSRIDRDAFTPVLVTNQAFEAEVANVAELGYRAQVDSTANVSLTLYHHRYPNLRSVALAPQPGTVVVANGFEGRTTGLEGWAGWRPVPWWRLTGGFTVMSEDIRVRAGQVDVGGVGQISNDPRHTAQLRSSWDIGRAWEADVAVRNVGHIPNFDVPQYTVWDSRIGWRSTRGLDVDLVVQNLFDRTYSEFGPAGGRAVFGRTWFLKLRWRG